MHYLLNTPVSACEVDWPLVLTRVSSLLSTRMLSTFGFTRYMKRLFRLDAVVVYARSTQSSTNVVR